MEDKFVTKFSARKTSEQIRRPSPNMQLEQRSLVLPINPKIFSPVMDCLIWKTTNSGQNAAMEHGSQHHLCPMQ